MYAGVARRVPFGVVLGGARGLLDKAAPDDCAGVLARGGKLAPHAARKHDVIGVQEAEEGT